MRREKPQEIPRRPSTRLIPDNTIIFRGVVVHLQKYDTLPAEFRSALETAFPKLIVRSSIAELVPFVPFEPEVDEPVEIQPPGDLIPHELGGFTVYQRAKDGYVNATAMCKAAGKLIGDWSRNIDTEKVIAALGPIIGIPIIELVVSKVGGNIPEEHRGT